MLDGIETDRAAVSERYLIPRLDIKMPFSPTLGEVRCDEPLVKADYKGMNIYGKPRGKQAAEFEQTRYWFRLRGSLIKVANNGLHNQDGKDPIELLYALDDIFTSLRINPFRTPLNGLELSITIKAANPTQLIANIVSYLNHPPNFKFIGRDGLLLPYAEVEAGQHKLKIYSPQEGLLRVEIKVDKMQYLGSNRPLTFADLAQPGYTALLSSKLLAAFKKIVWKCPDLDVDCLPPAERDLYLLGRVHDYWLVRRKDYQNQTDFKCVEKQRSRQKETYNDIVGRYWLSQPPAEIEPLLSQQLNQYGKLMQTPLYEALLAICLERWQYVGNLPGSIKSPNRLRLPPLSEIYPLYLGRFPTPLSYPHPQLSICSETTRFTSPQRGPSNGLMPVSKPGNTDPCMADQKRQLNSVKQAYRRLSRRVEKETRVGGQMLYAADVVQTMLSSKARLALSVFGEQHQQLSPQEPPSAVARGSTNHPGRAE